jgi:hypothetical protein
MHHRLVSPIRTVARPAALAAGAFALGSIAVGVSFASSGSAGAAAAPTPPATITSSAITKPPGTLAPGRSVGASTITGLRVFTNAHHGIALASTAQAQYPAVTTNGGASWHTNGPALHVNALQAPLSVVYVGAASSKIYFACCSGQVVDTTNDGGKHWWRAVLGDVVMSVVPRGNELIAFAQVAASQTSTKGITWVYVSKDGGKTWHYDNAEGAF